MKIRGGEFIYCDVSASDNIQQLYATVLNRHGKLDILVNCAGIWRTQRLEDITPKEFDAIYRTNVASVIFMTKAFMPMLLESEGSILNVASIGGMQSHIAGKSQYLYASSKAAVIQFSQLCALNYAKKVRVNCLCPGPTDTPIFMNRDFSWVPLQVPMGRLGQPSDCANAAVYLSSEEASYLTGVVLPVDGGASIR